MIRPSVCLLIYILAAPEFPSRINLHLNSLHLPICHSAKVPVSQVPESKRLRRTTYSPARPTAYEFESLHCIQTTPGKRRTILPPYHCFHHLARLSRNQIRTPRFTLHQPSRHMNMWDQPPIAETLVRVQPEHQEKR